MTQGCRLSLGGSPQLLMNLEGCLLEFSHPGSYVPRIRTLRRQEATLLILLSPGPKSPSLAWSNLWRIQESLPPAYPHSDPGVPAPSPLLHHPRGVLTQTPSPPGLEHLTSTCASLLKQPSPDTPQPRLPLQPCLSSCWWSLPFISSFSSCFSWPLWTR